MNRPVVSALVGVIVAFGMVGELGLPVAASLGIGVLAAVVTAIVMAVHSRTQQRREATES